MFCRIILRAGSARSTRVHGPRSGGTGIQVADPGAVPAPGTDPAGARADQIVVRDRITVPGTEVPAVEAAPAAAEIRETEVPAGRVRATEAAVPAADRFRTGGIRSGGAARPGIRERIGRRGASMIPKMGHIGTGDIGVM